MGMISSSAKEAALREIQGQMQYYESLGLSHKEMWEDIKTFIRDYIRACETGWE